MPKNSKVATLVEMSEGLAFSFSTFVILQLCTFFRLGLWRILDEVIFNLLMQGKENQ